MKIYDVIIVGGGPAGITASIAAAESNLDVLLLEATTMLGGSGTSAGVAHLLGGRSTDCKEYVTGGLFERLVKEAVAEGIAVEPEAVEGEYSPHGWNISGGTLTAGIPFKVCDMVEFFERKCIDAGVDVRYLAKVDGCEVVDSEIKSVSVKSETFFAKKFIDCSGDAVLAHLSSCEYVVGREEDNLTAPTSLIFHVSNVDDQKLATYIKDNNARRFLNEIAELTEKKIWNFPYNRLITIKLVDDGEYMINTNRLVGVDGLSDSSISNAVITARKEIKELFAIMKKFFVGFENAKISYMAPMLGIRETRRIVGDFVLTKEMLFEGVELNDIVGFSCYGWDLPNVKKPSLQEPPKEKIAFKYFPIPYRIMVPRGIKNLLCAGRCVSVERIVLGPLRVMASCMAMGEAAGIASSLKGDFNKIDVKELQNILNKRNVKTTF